MCPCWRARTRAPRGSLTGWEKRARQLDRRGRARPCSLFPATNTSPTQQRCLTGILRFVNSGAMTG
eukprot:7452098-Pyramimonas_sp.AAC.1